MNIFSYESKFNQAVMTMADMILLNLAYIICCLPIVTISSAQAGLYTGLRVLLDKDDDRSVIKAFFKGFADGIATSAIAGTIVLVFQAISVGLFLYAYFYYGSSGSTLPMILTIVLMTVVYTTHCILGPFHATFGCRVWQLIRNAFFVAFAYPLRALLVAVLTLLPLAIFLIWPQIIMGGIIAFLALYYSTAGLACTALLKKPFNRLKESFNAAHSEETEDEEAGEAEEAEEVEETDND